MSGFIGVEIAFLTGVYQLGASPIIRLRLALVAGRKARMRVRWCWMMLLGMAATACYGAETMGYRFVIEPYLATPVLKCPVLAQAPTASPFTAAGDELHDLTALARAERIPLADGWALWNQTRKLLVVRGPLVDQWRIAEVFGFNRQNRQVKVTVEWLRAKDPTAVPAEPAFATLGVLAKTCMKGDASATLEKPDGRWKFSAKVEPNVWEDGVIIDMKVAAEWKGPGVGGVQHGSVSTNVMVVDGRPCPLAAWYAVGHGDAWWLRLKADRLLADGSCWRDARLRQVGDAAQPWPMFTPTAMDGTVPEVRGWEVAAMTVPGDMIKTLVSGPDASDGKDPFATTPVEREYPRFSLPEAVIPDDLKDFLAPGMQDLSQVMVKAGRATGADDFVAYDPISHRVVFASKNSEVFDRIEGLFVGCDDRWGGARNREYETWLFDAAAPGAPWMRTLLTSKCSQMASIDWHGRKHRQIISFENELSVDESDNFDARYDLRCRMQPQADAGVDWHGNSMTHLVPGVPLLTDAFKLPDGRTLRQGQRARVLQMRTQ